MGIFDKLFGNKQEYPALDGNDPAAQRLEVFQDSLVQLSEETKDRLEVVPSDDKAYVFIGKPPKKFGIAWIEDDGKIVNFRSLVEEKGLSVISLERLSDRLKEVYIRHQQEPRFITTIRGHNIIVTPSETLMNDVKQVVNDTVG